MDQKVVIAHPYVSDETTGEPWNKGEAVRRYCVGGFGWRLKDKMLKQIPGAIRRKSGEGYLIPESQMTLNRRAEITAPIFAQPITDLKFEVNREQSYICATCQRESLGGDEITLIVHPASIIVSGDIQVNRVWIKAGVEYNLKNGVWEHRDSYTRHCDSNKTIAWVTKEKLYQEIGVIVASYLAQYMPTLTDAKRKELQRNINIRQEKLLELGRQMNVLHDEIAEYESALADLV